MSPKLARSYTIPFLMIKVKVRPASGEYDASNDAGGYKADEGTDFTPPPTTKAPTFHTCQKPKNKNILAVHCGGFFLPE